MIVIDVRTKEEFQEGHYPGSINIPLMDFSLRMHEIPRDTKVVMVCRSGKRASVGYEICAGAGYRNITRVCGWEELLGQKDN